MHDNLHTSLSNRAAIVAADCWHYLAALGYSIRLMLNRSDTAPTYHYGRHLDQTSYFKSQFQRQIVHSAERSMRWSARSLFVDMMPDIHSFAAYPIGSLGREFHDMQAGYRRTGLIDLRDRRLEVRKDERPALDLGNANERDFERFSVWLSARRNIFMTSTHDLCHLILGAAPDIAGEALVARYQYQTLLSAGNWLNMTLSLFVYGITFRWQSLARIISMFEPIDSAGDYSDLDFDRAWERQLVDIRRELRLPALGFMPNGRLPN